VADSPASFQPSKAAMSTGSRSRGALSSSITLVSLGGDHPRPSDPVVLGPTLRPSAGEGAVSGSRSDGRGDHHQVTSAGAASFGLFSQRELDRTVRVDGGVECLVVQHDGGFGVEEQPYTGVVEDLVARF